MTREARANVWFIAFFLAVSLPGAVILFKKKLEPTAPAMYLPDPVKRRAPYMMPRDVPPQVTRYAPELTAQWVEGLARERAGGAAEVMLHDRLPVVSDDRALQLIGVAADSSGTVLHALAWEPMERYSMLAESGGERLEGRVIKADTVTVPDAVRRELIYAGYSKPPRAVTWLTVRFDRDVATKRPLTFRMSYDAAGAPHVATVNLVGTDI